MATPGTKLILPLEPKEASKLWVNQRIGLEGPPGCGKSTFFSNADKALYIDTQGNIDHLKVKSLPMRSREDFIDIYNALTEAHQAGTFPYDTCVIDTVDYFALRFEEAVLTEARAKFKNSTINTLFDIPEGQGWTLTTKKTLSALNALDSLPWAIVLISHVKPTRKKQPTGEEYDGEGIALAGQLGTGVLAWIKHMMHVQVKQTGDTMQRIVRTRPIQGMEGKSHGGIIPDKLTWETADLAREYKQLRACFD